MGEKRFFFCRNYFGKNPMLQDYTIIFYLFYEYESYSSIIFSRKRSSRSRGKILWREMTKATQIF